MRGGGGGFRGGGFVGGGFRSGFVGGGGFRGGFVGPAFRGNFGFVNRPFFFPRHRFGFVGRPFFFPRHRFFFGFGGFWGYPNWFYPYAYNGPSYYNGPAYPYTYDYGYASAPASPPVVIDQNYSSDPPRGETGPSFYREADYYLIAFNDHTIRAAVSFWVEGDEIHWISREHEQKQAALSSVDRGFSERINRDRRVEFRLP